VLSHNNTIVLIDGRIFLGAFFIRNCDGFRLLLKDVEGEASFAIIVFLPFFDLLIKFPEEVVIACFGDHFLLRSNLRETSLNSLILLNQQQKGLRNLVILQLS
jgi:hypothetical protein